MKKQKPECRKVEVKVYCAVHQVEILSRIVYPAGIELLTDDLPKFFPACPLCGRGSGAGRLFAGSSYNGK